MIKCPKCKSELVATDCQWNLQKEYIYITFCCDECDIFYESKFKIDDLELEEVVD